MFMKLKKLNFDLLSSLMVELYQGLYVTILDTFRSGEEDWSGADWLAAGAASLGAFGVLISVKIRCVPLFGFKIRWKDRLLSDF